MAIKGRKRKAIKKDDKKAERYRTSPAKIALYVQNMSQKGMGKKEILLIITDRFDKRDVMTFADKYRRCNLEKVGHIADVLCTITHRNLDNVLKAYAEDIEWRR